MILLLLLSLLLPQLTAVILIWIVWPVQKLTRYDFLLKFCFAVGIGFGILSCVFFLQLSLFGPSRTGLVSTQIALLIALVAIFFYRTREAKKSPPVLGDSDQPLKPSRFAATLSVLFFVALVSAACAFVFISLRQPHGEWDAWAVYNMKARFFFRGGEYWRDIFSEPTGWTSPDYPLLLPATIAACWTLISRDTVAVPVIVAFLFTFATVGLVTGGVSILRGKSQGALAGLVLVCTPFFIKHGANQYTDIPLAFFFTATIILLHLKDKLPDGERRFLLLAGMMTGFSAWTKNEGFLFLVAILVSRFVVVVPKDGLKPYLRQMRFFAVGLIPVLLVVIYFKATLATPNRMLFPPQGPRLVEKLLDSSRYLTILDAFVREALGLGNWAASIIPLLLFYLLLFGASIKQEEKRAIVASLLVVGIMLAGYFAAFVLSPLDVSLHLSTSLNRVSLHVWPSLVVIFFLIVRTPEQAFVKADVISLPA